MIPVAGPCFSGGRRGINSLVEASFFWAWGISAAVIAALAAFLGRKVTAPGGGWLGILIDNRGRFSLTHFQLALWSLVVLSLVSGLFWGRLIEGGDIDPLGFSIPAEVLGLLGISLGSGIASSVVKAGKDQTVPERIAADSPHLSQMFMIEEGTFADKVVDISKFQGFVVTLILVIAFVVQAIDQIDSAKEAAEIALPTFSPTFLTLLGISHAAYVGGKLAPHEGTPPTGLTVKNRLEGQNPS